MEVYGPAGPWVDIFPPRTRLPGHGPVRSDRNARLFLTFDRWETAPPTRSSAGAGTEYAALDAACEGLTVRESFLSAWEG